MTLGHGYHGKLVWSYHGVVGLVMVLFGWYCLFCHGYHGKLVW